MTLDLNHAFAASARDVDLAIQQARALSQHGNHRDAVNVLADAVDAYGATAIPLLVELHACYERMPASRYERYVWRYFKFPIGPGDRVLDVGGSDPIPGTTEVIEDLDELATIPDDAFDFVACSHVLEKTQDPARVLRELMRVGRAGYVESPTPGKATFLNLVANHRHAVTLSGGVIHVREYAPYELRGVGSELLVHMRRKPSTAREKAFSALMTLRAERLNTMMHWVDDFEWEVCRLDGTVEMSAVVQAPASGATRGQQPLERRHA